MDFLPAHAPALAALLKVWSPDTQLTGSFRIPGNSFKMPLAPIY